MQPGGIMLFTNPDGRITRATFWLGLLTLIALKLVARFALGLPLLTTPADAFSLRLWSFIIDVAVIYPGAVLLVKRLHDRNLPGQLIVWLILPHAVLMITNLLGMSGDLKHMGVAESLLVLATGIVTIAFIGNLGFCRGTVGPNRYGPEPLKKGSWESAAPEAGGRRRRIKADSEFR
jgi:uncharacterized membrane protein YhaH (DUF805 family)